MRAVLEYLGILEPDGSRKEPVALPAWVRTARLWIVPGLAVASTAVARVIRAILT